VLFWPAAPLALPSIEVTGTFYILAAWHSLNLIMPRTFSYVV
jgi:hypothetical protein